MNKRDTIEMVLVVFCVCCVFVIAMIVMAVHIGAVQF